MLDDDFKQKNSLGTKIEEAIAQYYRDVLGMKAYLPHPFNKGFDIVCPEVGNIEVKEDRMAHASDNYAIEYQNYRDEPSGLFGTKAETFVIVDYDNVIISTTENLKYVVNESKRKRFVPMGYKTSMGRQCKGWLIPRGEILYSPFVEVHKRWFPHWRYINGKLY